MKDADWNRGVAKEIRVIPSDTLFKYEKTNMMSLLKKGASLSCKKKAQEFMKKEWLPSVRINCKI